jgi:hypothetical protein
LLLVRRSPGQELDYLQQLLHRMQLRYSGNGGSFVRFHQLRVASKRPYFSLLAPQPGDVYIDHSVPVFQNGVPTEQCQFSSGAPLQANVTVSGNTFWQDAGQAAVVGYSISGAVVDGNVVTRLPGTPVPQFDLVCERCIDAIAGSNTCNGGPCNASGF